MKKRENHQQGFTLIELIIVIILLSILSAVVLTRYINAAQQARIAKVQAIFGAIRTASALAKSACILDVGGASLNPTCTLTAGTVNMDGVQVAMINEYPAATLDGIIAATQLIPAADNIIVTPGNPLTIDIMGGTIPNCRVSYTAALAGFEPVYSMSITGC